MNAWNAPRNRRLIGRYLRTFRPYGRSNRGLVVGAVVLTIVLAAMTLPLPWLTMKGIDLMVEAQRPSLIWTILGVWAAVRFLGTGLELWRGFICDRFAKRVATRAKIRLFRHIQALPLSVFHEKSVGYLVCRVRDDVDGLAALWLDSLTQIVRSGVYLLATLTLVLLISWKLTLVALLAVPLYVLVFSLFADRIRTQTLSVRERFGELEGAMHDSFAAASTVKLFARETHEARRVAARMVATARDLFRLEVFQRTSSSLGALAQSLAPLVVLAYAGHEIMEGKLSVGELVGFVSYVALLFQPVSVLLRRNIELQKAVASLDRVLEILDLEAEENRRPRCGRAYPKPAGEVEFRSLSFSYRPDRIALDQIDVVVPARATFGIAGPSGAGKSTLANMIPRVLEPQEGSVLIDGVDVRDIPLSVLRSQIGVVSQDTFLFSRSIRENIRYGRLDATDVEVEDAARRAFAHEFICSLPDGYDTEVGNLGAKVSGGERARISIARSLLKDPAILILDEATAFLDSRSEAELHSAIEEVLTDRTALVIAHRLSTIELTDQILVLEAGRLVESGTHRELLWKRGLYRRLYDEQFDRGRTGGERVTSDPDWVGADPISKRKGAAVMQTTMEEGVARIDEVAAAGTFAAVSGNGTLSNSSEETQR